MFQMQNLLLLFGVIAFGQCLERRKVGRDSNNAVKESSVCRKPKETGPCRAFFPRFYYDSKQKKCVGFVYGGCQGNDNNFFSPTECRNACMRKEPAKKPNIARRMRKPASVCFLPKVTGFCGTKKYQYYYDTRLKRCKRFLYGGCKSNKNNFQSFRQCATSCHTRRRRIARRPAGRKVVRSR